MTAPRASGSASPTRPIGVPAGTGSARNCSGTPSQASASGHQARSRSESIPVRDASDSSATAAAPSERATHSGSPSQCTAAAAAGAWERCHRSLLSVHSDEAGRPVCAANRRAPSSVAMARASSAPRLSCHAIAGPTGSPRRSSSTPVSAMPAIPTAATTPAGESPSAREATAHAVRVIATGSSSAPVGTGVHGVRSRASPSSSPSASSTSALQYVVPTSMPTRSCRTARPLRRRSSEGPPCAGEPLRRGTAAARRRAGRRPPSTASARR